MDALLGFPDAVIILGGHGCRHINLAAEEHASPFRDQVKSALAFDGMNERKIAEFLKVCILRVRKVEIALKVKFISVVRVDELNGFNEAGDEAGGKSVVPDTRVIHVVVIIYMRTSIGYKSMR